MMSKTRISEPYAQLSQCLQQILKQPLRKTYRADRLQKRVLWLNNDDRLRLNSFRQDVLFPNPYDTKENRFVRYLLRSLRVHLDDLKECFVSFVSEDDLDALCSTHEELLLHPCLQRLSEKKEDPASVDLHRLPEEYRKFYHSYVILKFAICELEAEMKNGLALVNWEERDVLVGSFGSEEQFKHNLAKKYYYAPERHFDPTCFPIRYVALYQSAHFAESGIRYYGEVTGIKRVQRKKIRFGVRRKNGEEGYFVFRVKQWEKLPIPIAIQDEGVFAPKYTNLFLLTHCQKTYELFHLRSEQEYRAYRQLQRVLAYASNQLDWKEIYPIEGGKSVWVHDGNFDLLDEQGKLMRSISVLDFYQNPTTYLDDIFACVKYQSESTDAPSWLIRENEFYRERYGTPYSDE